ncbi:MAG TPA: SDR family NAD(P)-dependent oxidoreductase [Chitinophagaceae bacterium]|nr:SDR family NAD(P)-dependent oxidoreductase [Chitinophagaceae bacterium]
MNSAFNDTFTLITGASEGLGKALAIECASKGMNVFLVALPGIELYQLASYIRRKYKVLVCEFETDLSLEMNRITLAGFIKKQQININMLINNAGIGGSVNFDECAFDFFKTQISLNVLATVHLTYLLLPELKKNSRSYILNVSSLCIFFYLVKKQVYGATKSFIHFFSKSLKKELKKDGVTVSVLCPGGMNSNPSFYLLHQMSNWMTRSAAMDPEEVAPVALNGLINGKEIIIPGKWNRVFLFFDKLLPGWLKEKMTARHIKSISAQQIALLLKGKPIAETKNAA